MTEPLDKFTGTMPAGSQIEPDAHGQAALLLIESLIHTLVDARLIDTQTAAATVRSAAEVKVEVAEAAGESAKRMNESLALLQAIETSFEADLGWQGQSLTIVGASAD